MNMMIFLERTFMLMDAPLITKIHQQRTEQESIS